MLLFHSFVVLSKLPHKKQTPYYRQPSVAAAGSPSVLSGVFSRFSSSSSSSSLQINYFVREDEGGKTETKQGGAPCSTSGVVLYNLTFEFLNTSFFWSFFFICINIFLGLQSLSLRFFTAFLHLGKGLCELLFPVPFEMRQPPGKKYKNQPTTSYLPPFISIPPYWRRWAASSYRSPLLFHSSFFNSK